MRRFDVNDPLTRARLELWSDGLAQQLMLRAEERLADARAIPAIRAARYGSATQGWLYPLLIEVSRRLLRLVVQRATSA
jgi:hypothetical protein